jgi:Tfp pilus assembly protein PilX
MTARLRSEDGWTLVTAIILMTVMLGVGLATATMVDTQAKQSAQTRQRDTAFNLAEAALNAQIYALSLRWPGYGYKDAAAYRSYSCSSGGSEPVLAPAPANQAQLAAATPVCPSPATLAPLLNNVDARGVSSWTTRVYDDPSPTASAADRGKHYSDSLVVAGDALTSADGTVVPTQPGVGYDSNKDGKLWVKASATASGHTRTLVSLIKVETVQKDSLNTALLAGSLDFSNNGNHSGFFIDQTTATAPNVMTVRCNPTDPPTFSCLGYPATDRNWAAEIGGAIDPPNYSANPSAPNAFDAATLDGFLADAVTDHTYYDSVGPLNCSGVDRTPALNFRVLYIKDCGLLHWPSNGTVPLTGQGLVILDNTRLLITGDVTINGIVYARRPPVTNPTVELHGCSQIAGSLMIDDLGSASIGSCSQTDRPELLFVPSASETLKTYASAGIIQNTWRELSP